MEVLWQVRLSRLLKRWVSSAGCSLSYPRQLLSHNSSVLKSMQHGACESKVVLCRLGCPGAGC